jgi:hypothetical protein
MSTERQQQIDELEKLLKVPPGSIDPEKEIWYIAGPMRGRPGLNWENFDRVARKIRELGHTAINPADIDRLAGRTVAEYEAMDPKELDEAARRCIEQDKKIVALCDGIVLLEDWHYSEGAREELGVALANGLSIAVEPLVVELPPDEKDPNLSILQEAEALIHGQRGEDYGHPADNHLNTANLWSEYIDYKTGYPVKLSAEDVCWMMVLLKMSRQCNAPKRDNLTDACGYIGNIEMIQRRGEGGRWS